MYWLYLLSLSLIAATWLFALRTGFRWLGRLEVDCRVSVWALATVLPTSGLILSVHLMALASLVTGSGMVTPLSVACVYVALAWWVERIIPRSSLQSFDRSVATRRFSLKEMKFRLPVAIVAGMYGVFLIDALTRYPSGYDALYYHLPVAARWMQEQALNLVFGFSFLSQPENGMIIPFLLIFTGAKWILPIVHLPKALLVGAAVFGLSRSLGAGRTASTAAVCIVLSVPIVVFQSFSGYIDLYASASWLTALLGLVWASKAQDSGQQRSLCILAGLSAGVALGSKITFLVLVALLVIVAALVNRIGRTCDVPRWTKTSLNNAMVFMVATLVCSGFWFVRGTVQAGNPIYPLGVNIAGYQLLPDDTARYYATRSIGQKIQRWWDYSWHETKFSASDPSYVYGVNNALGAAYATFVPLGFLAAISFLWTHRRRSDPDPAKHWLFVYLLLVMSGVALHLTVFHEMLRFVVPLLLLAVPVAVLLLDRLIRRFPRSSHAMLCIALAVTAVVATFKPAHSFAARVKNSDWKRSTYYLIPPLFDELPLGTCVLNLSDPLWNYALLGEQLSNVVIHPPVWHESLCPEGMSSRALREHSVDYIYTRYPWTTDWPDDLPIQLVYDDTDDPPPYGIPATRVYRVTSRGQSTALSRNSSSTSKLAYRQNLADQPVALTPVIIKRTTLLNRR